MGASDIRRELEEYLSYLNLINALVVEHEDRPQVVSVMLPVAKFIDNATSKELRARGKELAVTLKDAAAQSSKFISRLKTIREIAQDFIKLSQQTDVWRLGIPYGWLSKRFDPNSLTYSSDLPPQARIGIGVHVGKVNVEEMFLLDDTFLLLAQAEAIYQNLQLVGEQTKKEQISSVDEKTYKKLSALNSEVCTYSRLCVLSSAAFVEAFVNSVGWAETQRRDDMSIDVIEELKGTKKGRYLSLERKLERYPKLIRLDGTSPIILSDERQRKEPFISFLSETKELRDSTMHSAPSKASIWLSPKEWLDLAQRSVKHAVEVGQEFWEACYPEKGLPDYLEQLNAECLHKRAFERVMLSLD